MEMHSPEDAQTFSHFSGHSSAACITRETTSIAMRHSIQAGLQMGSVSLKTKNGSTGDGGNADSKHNSTEGRVLAVKEVEDTEAGSPW